MAVFVESSASERHGDIIIELDGHPIAGIDGLHKLLNEQRIGRRSRLGILRHTERLELEIVPAESRSHDE